MLLQPTEAQLISTILPVSNVLDDEDRSGVGKMMWEIVHADGSVSECEANLIWRVADLLGVSGRQRNELRRR
jgi:uncharacterized tellurite resistance protein B-like protein